MVDKAPKFERLVTPGYQPQKWVQRKSVGSFRDENIQLKQQIQDYEKKLNAAEIEARKLEKENKKQYKEIKQLIDIENKKHKSKRKNKIFQRTLEEDQEFDEKCINQLAKIRANVEQII